MNLPDLSRTEPDEIELAPGATALDFLRAVYRDPQQPVPRRMKAAIETLPFEHPKLAVTANLDGRYASQLEAAMERRGMSPVIDAAPQPKAIAKSP